MKKMLFVLLLLALFMILLADGAQDVLKRYKQELEHPSDGNPQVTDQRRCSIVWELRNFRTKTAVEGLLDIFKTDCSQDVRMYALFALAEIGTLDAFSALIDALIYEESNPKVKRRGPNHSAPNNERYEYIPDAIYGALEKLGKERIREFAKKVFAESRMKRLFPMVLRVVSDLGIEGLDSSLSALLASKKNKKILADILAAVVAVGKEKGLVSAAVAVGAAAKEKGARVLAALLLKKLVPEDGLFDYARRLIGDDAWQVRAAVIESLSHLQRKETVDIFIEALKKEEGRLKADIAFALNRLTDRWFADDAQGWADWWKVAREDFVFPKIHEGGPRKEGPKKSYRTEPAKYYGLEVISGRIAFILDVSGSMEEETEVEIEGKRYRGPKLAVAKGELWRCLKKLPPNVRFNIVIFHTEFTPWRKRLVKASGGAKKSAIEFVSQLSPQMDTNIYDAVAFAMSDPSVDTIYLLSDGLPNCGRVPTPEAVLREVRRLNLTRRVVINTIAFGTEEGIDFMKRLAAENGGKFVDMTGR